MGVRVQNYPQVVGTCPTYQPQLKIHKIDLKKSLISFTTKSGEAIRVSHGPLRETAMRARGNVRVIVRVRVSVT